LAAEAKRAELDNTNIPQLPALSEADKADAEAFLQDMLLCLSILGINVFEKAQAHSDKSCDLILSAKGIEARGQYTPEGFLVCAGSQAAKEEVPSIHHFLKELRKVLLEKRIFVDDGTYYRLTQDYIFSSPSTAAGVLLGRPANGLLEWKDKNVVVPSRKSRKLTLRSCSPITQFWVYAPAAVVPLPGGVAFEGDS
jgi:hypothetical protein